ncbi:MAG: hypothetical protein M1820_010040 [Bogoriella megaspora]|nr:MAG: hypothetical protein M1820_010040 [Bogoriella megaspora]
MADDTREQAAAAPVSREKLEHQMQDVAQEKRDSEVARPSQSANIMPGGTQNTAGGQVKQASAVEAFKTIRLDDFKEFHKKPCVRDAMMTGIVAGFAVGGVRALLGASIVKCSNWAVGTWMGTSFFTYEYCGVKRSMEKDGMRRAVKVMEDKRSEREEKMKLARETRRKAKEEADRLEEERRREEQSNRWWKFW